MTVTKAEIAKKLVRYTSLMPKIRPLSEITQSKGPKGAKQSGRSIGMTMGNVWAHPYAKIYSRKQHEWR